MKFTIVLPFFNEELNVQEFLEALEVTLSTTSHQFFLVAIDDGSLDQTYNALKKYLPQSRDIRSHLIKLEQNYGHERALHSGFSYAVNNIDFDGLITMDTDLQDPPEILKLMLARFEVSRMSIFAKSSERSDSTQKRLFAALYYKVQAFFTGTQEFNQVRNFFIIPKSVAVGLASSVQHFQSTRMNLIEMVRKNAQFIEFERSSRFAGETHYKILDSFRLALDGLLSQPKKIIAMTEVLIGISLLFTLSTGAYIVYVRLIQPEQTLPGIPLSILVNSFFFLLNLILIYIVISLLTRVFAFTRGLPGYLVSEIEVKND
jgi:glycosyltransferase involved in cell wall biosynthesis